MPRSREYCAICHCELHRTAGTYAQPNDKGRGHATRHHFVAERFFGRSTNRSELTDGVFSECPWGVEGQSDVFCYECHEELLHNPVLLPDDISKLAELVARRGLDETTKSTDRSPLAGRIKLLQEAIARGLDVLLTEAPESDQEAI